MSRFCEHIIRTVCADLDVELAEFNGEADHMHLLVHYPTNTGDLRARPPAQEAVLPTRCGGNTPAVVSTPGCADTFWSLSSFAVSYRGTPLSTIKHYIDSQARPL